MVPKSSPWCLFRTSKFMFSSWVFESWQWNLIHSRSFKPHLTHFPAFRFTCWSIEWFIHYFPLPGGLASLLKIAGKHYTVGSVARSTLFLSLWLFPWARRTCPLQSQQHRQRLESLLEAETPGCHPLWSHCLLLHHSVTLDPNLSLFLTSLVHHRVEPIPRQWVVIKSIFTRLLILCEMITQRLFTRAVRKESSGEAGVFIEPMSSL